MTDNNNTDLTFSAVIAALQEKIAVVDNDLMMETVGVAQALGELREALAAIDTHLDQREFEKAAALGYSTVSSGYVFLQRTLGGLQTAYGHNAP